MVHRVAEHATEFHLLDDLLDLFGIAFDGDDGVVIAFFAAHLEQVERVGDVGASLFQRQDDAFEGFLFLAEFERPFLVVPDGRVFQLLVDLF
jgi:hypothetical protein